MNRAPFLFTVFLISWSVSYAQVFDVDTLQYTGDIDQRINLVILGDGYQETELQQFITDAGNFTDTFFSNSPYLEYRQFFNVFTIKVPSNESGASHPGTATDVMEPEHPVIEVDNYFGSIFDYYEIHRLLVPVNTSAIMNVLANNFPSYDQVVMLVNTPYYGGSGGQWATASTNPESSDVAIHELGHSFVGLKDEYWAGDFYAAEGINMTQETDPLLVRWKNWMGDYGVGIYQHCCGETSASWYKPHENCKMQYLNKPFCPVCVEGTIERIHALTDPIISYSPAEKNISTLSCDVEFSVDLVEPEPNTLRRRWILNDVEIERNMDVVQVSGDSLNVGANTLKLVIEDTTELLRVDNHENMHVYNVSWNITNNLNLVNKEETICQGDSIYLQQAYQKQAGIYYDTLISVSGCDSIIATSLTVDSVDVSVIQTGASLMANAGDAIFQWLDCNDYSQIEGATGQSFRAEKDGAYAVEITRNGCKDTSECFTVNTTGIFESGQTDVFFVSPNPTRDKLNVSVSQDVYSTDCILRIISIDGRIVYSGELSGRRMIIDVSDLGQDGLYYLQLLNPEAAIIGVIKIVLDR